MQVKVKFLRQAGKASLSLDATELHTYLDSQGVEKDGTGNYKDQPYTETDVIDTYRNKISTRALLRPGVQMINLGDYYQQPVGVDRLNALADSVGEVVRSVVDHYRPIEISVVISGKRAS